MLYAAAAAAAAAAKLLQLCPTLCDPIDGSPLGSSVPGILQARILVRAAISFSNAWKWKVKVKSFSRALLLVTPWTTACQAPPSMGFSMQEYSSGLPLPSPYSYIYTCICIYTKSHNTKVLKVSSLLWSLNYINYMWTFTKIYFLHIELDWCAFRNASRVSFSNFTKNVNNIAYLVKDQIL